MPDDPCDERVDDLLHQLTFRERQTIRLRFGLEDGIWHTVRKVARLCNVTDARVRSVEKSALAKIGRRLFVVEMMNNA